MSFKNHVNVVVVGSGAGGGVVAKELKGSTQNDLVFIFYHITKETILHDLDSLIYLI